MTYREGECLRSAKKRARHLANVFDDLESIIHMSLIEALAETAETQNNHPRVGERGYPRTMFKSEPHDGFYTYRGSMDTAMVAEYINIAVAEKLRKVRKRRKKHADAS